MGVVVAMADTADEAALDLEALGFDTAEVVHEMASADAEEAVLDGLGFNAFARELAETVQEMEAADADEEAVLDALEALSREVAEAVIQDDDDDMEAADTDEAAAAAVNTFPLELAEAFLHEIEMAEAEEAALEAMGFNAFARELRDIRVRDEEAFLDELDYLEIARAIDQALEEWEEYREQVTSAARAAAMSVPGHAANSCS